MKSECYPAKLAHGHVSWLIKQGVKYIFYPCIPYEREEFADSVNHYNCPIVTSYAENIKNNIDELNDPEIRFHNPFLAMTNEETITERLLEEFKDIPPRKSLMLPMLPGKKWPNAGRISAEKARKPCAIWIKQDGGVLCWQEDLTTLIRKFITVFRI